MIVVIRHAVRVEKVGVKKCAKKAGVADRAVTTVVNGDDTISGDDLLKLHHAVEELLAAKRAEELWISELLEWVKKRGAGRVAAEIAYDPSNMAKVVSGKITPKKIIARIMRLRASVTASANMM
jgi:hypothetical protein